MAEQLLPSISHLRTDDGNPDLTVHAWDSASTGVAPPVPAWTLDDYGEQGRIRGFFGGGFYAVWDWGSRALTVVDIERRLAFLWTPTFENLGLPERGAPFRTLLNLWLIGEDTQLVHGAAVGRPDGCLLLVGPSGAGKSSTALSCLGSPLRHIGEDYCLATRGAPPEVASIYCSAKLAPGALPRLPSVQGLEMVMPPPGDAEGKAQVDLNSAMPETLLRSAPLRAVVVPSVSSGATETTFRSSGAGSALAAVAPSTILQIPGEGRSTMGWLTDLVTSVPCFELKLGSDPALVVTALESLLDEA